MFEQTEPQRETVPLLDFAIQQMARHAREIRARWAWVEPLVWTVRMLTALEEGVKGGKWFSLMDKVYALDNLRAAFARVKANRGAAGVDHQTTEMFAQNLEANLETLAKQLKAGNYKPLEVKRTWIPKPGSTEKRPLGIPTVRDRVVQTALRSVLEPIFEWTFHKHNYGFRPGRSCKDALRRVNQLLRNGYTWIVDVDLKRYFDTIPREQLMARVAERVSDGRVLGLIRLFLEQGVMEDLTVTFPEDGTPQGGVISPLLSNIYLNPLDHLMGQTGFEMIRYADDFVIMCRSEEEAQAAMGRLKEWTKEAGLNLHPEKTRIVQVVLGRRDSESFDFLGYTFWGEWKLPRKKSLQKLKDTIREKTPRRNGKSLPEFITNVNRTLRGWFEYFKHSIRGPLSKLDSWIRRRLRSILQTRHHQRKRSGRGKAHLQWPNAYFTKHGLFSLETAHVEACQSSKRQP